MGSLILKRLFLSLIIVSALASAEGGVYSSADLIDYYLTNLVASGMIESNTSLNPPTGDMGSQVKNGTPLSSFKSISNQLILKYQQKVKKVYWPFVTENAYTLMLIFAVSACFVYICLIVRKNILLNLTDNSPPAVI
jgi:hypothetical protein